MLFIENLADILTKNTNHLIDWNRIGSVVGARQYTYRELAERGFIIASMAAGGFLAKNQREQGGIASFAGGAFLAFLLAHTITMSPLIYKRIKLQGACNDIKTRLDEQLMSEPELRDSVIELINKIMKLATVRGASAVWSHRLSLLNRLEKLVTNADHNQLLSQLNNPHFTNSFMYESPLDEDEDYVIKNVMQ